MEIDNKFPSRLFEMRKTHSMTQTDVADAVGISQRQVATYEAGRAKPREKTLFKLAYYLGVPPSWLANGSNAKFNEWDEYTPTIESKQIPLYEKYSEIKHDINCDSLRTLRNRLVHTSNLYDAQNLFAVTIQGDSMDGGNNLGIPDGSIVTFKPKPFEFTNGGFYLIQVEDIITFKQIFRDELKTRMHPLNLDYADSVYNNNEYNILAKAVYVEINLENK